MSHIGSTFACHTYQCEQPWTQAETEKYRSRISNVKPRIDCSVPSSYYVMLNRAKKEQQNNDWCQQVDRENALLLQRMQRVMSQHHLDDHLPSQYLQHHSQSGLSRQREQRRIDDCNRLILERIKGQSSAYSRDIMQAHAKKYEKYRAEMKARQRLNRISNQRNSNARQQYNDNNSNTRSDGDSNSGNSNNNSSSNNGASWSIGEDGQVIYDKDERQVDSEKQESSDEQQLKELQQAQISAFDDCLIDAEDVSRAGPSGIQQYQPPVESECRQLLQQGYRIDDRHVIVTIDEIHGSASRPTPQPEILDQDWKPFTIHPPTALHAILIRTYDLDSTLHSHLYLPFHPLQKLGKTKQQVAEKLLPLLGFTQEGELYFHQQALLPRKKGKAGDKARLNKEEFIKQQLKEAAEKKAKKRKQKTSQETQSSMSETGSSNDSTTQKSQAEAAAVARAATDNAGENNVESNGEKEAATSTSTTTTATALTTTTAQ